MINFERRIAFLFDLVGKRLDQRTHFTLHREYLARTVPLSVTGGTKLDVLPVNCLVARETTHNLLIDFLWSRGHTIFLPLALQSHASHDLFTPTSRARTNMVH